ncbi:MULTISPECIES: daunorubicin resistance protein DrrA family ABC transporter ATP-binding protein [Streptomycetaceae]|uniref:ABC-type xenobiotic transporter n=1 Tax=Streptantibioticus cattleyicolor (strain ATCC 35852 / DSM 46488 / JCM 4925 / NBRC 14057 / NRRL 8057) TaxID=1003195 RepID=F8K3C9_STREN|nr:MULTISPECIES: daunorubicin resistance protein DrrA family ABC transporter ATP-binding protein [Streptomycetaceae]AEW95043.1 ABC transporter ATP-binding protein [Streptantibioticus cattleyicolor NRRL 8057 = DSM 46488]MYS59640.1 daunorubicin resistance protein DrrA family ABC transporter ATP-binding protein [Streptomyces sp. SID5468]CCB75393.1 Daunorubicin resistance ATP-binding protein drrA [Streptantibioticus cattleyicolor NRRL 8057 = DSM 46488]
MTPAIEIDRLEKSFGSTRAIRGLSLQVPAGKVLGLLGPNGAGKTTLVRVVSTLVEPDAGRVLVHGHDVVRQAARVRPLIGLTGQYASVDEDMPGRENLYVIARLFNFSRRAARSRADELLERFGLTEAGGRPCGGYSGGMRRRLDLAASLVGEPRVLVLDEPTTGLDPHSRNALWAEVRRLADAGTTVLLTTQYMEEAEALADSLVVIDRGQVIATGRTAELRERFGGQTLRVRPEHPGALPALQAALASAGHRVTVVEGDGGAPQSLRLPLSGGGEALTALIRTLGAAGVPLASVETSLPSLDEVFLMLTGSSRGRGPEEPETPAGPADDLVRPAARSAV